MLLTTIISKILGYIFCFNNFIFLKNFDPHYSYIEVQLLNQNSKPLKIEGKINITLLINKTVKCKK